MYFTVPIYTVCTLSSYTGMSTYNIVRTVCSVCTVYYSTVQYFVHLFP
jgi:hypothetical protein